MTTNLRTQGVHKMRRLYRRAPRATVLLLALSSTLALAAGESASIDAAPLVEGVDCVGNAALSCSAMRERAGIAVGQVMDESEIENARLRLQALPSVKTASIHLVKGSRRGQVLVILAVTEADPVTTAFSAGTLAEIAGQGRRFETLAARITDHDLFGSGKTIDLTLVGALPVLGSGSGNEYAARLQYFDPRLFGSDRLFLVAGAFYSRSSLDLAYVSYSAFSYGTSSESGGGVDLSLGLHLDSHSYLTLGYRYLDATAASDGVQWLTSDGLMTTVSPVPHGALLFTVGRNTEDDPSFPTRGWLIHAYEQWASSVFGGPGPTSHNYTGVLARATWRAGADSFWTLQARPVDNFQTVFDDDLGYSIVYSHTLFQDAGGRRSRWYVGPGFSTRQRPADFAAGHDFEAGIKAGLRFETKHLGTVNFYVIAAHPFHGGF